MTDRILIIEDDPEFTEELREILSDEGYAVERAPDGISGMSMIEELGCDILILDLKLPGLSGFDILKRLQMMDHTMKIIVITGNPSALAGVNMEIKNSPEEELELLKSASDVLKKTFDIEDLLRALKS